MNMDIQPLRDLNSLKRRSPMGIFKRWIYKDSSSEELAGDYLQKISFSIQDFNKTISKKQLDYKDIVFIVCLIDWIRNSVNCLKKLFGNSVLNNFSFSSNNDLSKAKAYFLAIRSFIVAHPLETTKHGKFSLDGTYICLDLFQNDGLMKVMSEREERYRFFDYGGMHEGRGKCDFYLKAYSSKYYQNQFFLLIGFCLEDIVRYARLCIQELYEMDKYLFVLKKNDFKEGAR